MTLMLPALVGSPATAQMGGGAGRGKGLPMYDPGAEVTLTGSVEEVNERSGSMGMTGTHLVMRTEEETLDVHLGPSSYLAEKGFAFQKGDRIEVSGSRVQQGEASFVIAREVKRGEEALTLRDAQGPPAWARPGGGRRGPGRGR